MAVPKRKAEYLGLKNIDVLIRDTSYESDYFNVLECSSVLTQGKSSFLIAGSDRLKSGVDIKMELVHNETQKSIYLQPVEGHLEGSSRRVTIEVYEDVIPGQYTLYIIGELDPNWYSENIGGMIPAEWSNIYNVRWTKNISVNAGAVNTQPIFFYKQPTISISEQFKEFVNVPSSSAIPIYLSGSGVPRGGIPTIVPTQNSTEGGFGDSTYPQLDFANKAKESIIEENKATTKLKGSKGAIGSKSKLVQTMSPVPDDYLINVSGDSSVNSLYVGNTFHIDNPQVDTSKFTVHSYHSVPTIYSSSIMRVIDNTAFVPKDVFYVNDNRSTPPTLVPAPFKDTWPITSSYYDLGTQTTSSINFFSFADITIDSMKTFSGDVHKIKVYSRSEGSLSDFELIYDSPLESAQVLYDKSEPTTLNNMGYFLDVARINKYWDIYDGTNGLEVSTPGFKYDSSYKIDSMHITGSNYGVDDSIRVQHSTAIDFLKGTLYNFKAKIYGKKSLKQQSDNSEESHGSFKVYVSGDAFEGTTNEGSHWGFERLSIPDFPTGVTEYDFGTVEGSFLADNSGTGTIQFKVDSGEWHVSDIQVKTATDTAFNPESINVVTPLPPLMSRPDNVRFLVEFYDVNNNIADSVVFSQPFTFQGANTNIGGSDNILSGSMYIGNALASGVEMAGVDSAFIRSMGYQGFTSASNAAGDNSGFMIYSGSVLPDSGDDYKGVGFELVGNSGSYFKFGTSPSELDIRTDKFFIGQEAIQFISGSDGNIEISSSIFHLDPKNNKLIIGAGTVINATLSADEILTPATIGGVQSTVANASASITADGLATFKSGSIAGWKIFGNILSGSNASLDAEGAALYMSTKGPSTDDSAAFDIMRDEYYIDFTPADQGNDTNYFVKFGPNFAVSSEGVLHASGAIFEGTITASAGNIGGANIESASLTYSPYWRISSSNDQNDPASFISSSRFKVSAGGNITGSQVLFTGGKIGGFELDSTQINSSNDNLILKSSGHITGSQVLFSGGKIAGWDIDSTTIASADDKVIIDSSNKRITINNTTFGDSGIQLDYNSGTPRFYVGNGSDRHLKYDGTDVDIQSRKFELDATDLEISSTQKSMSLGEGKIRLVGGSTSTITVGSSSGAITLSDDGTDRFMSVGKSGFSQFDQSTAGIILGTDAGTAKFEVVASAADYLSFDGSSLDIKYQVFDLDAGSLIMESATNNGKIALGSTPPTAHNSGNGIYFDGDAKFLIGSSSGDHLQYDGTDFDVKVGSLELDATNIEISSTKASMSLGEGNIILDGANSKVTIGSTSTKQITLQGHADYGYIATGKTSATSTTAGFWLANNNTDPEFHVGNATDFIKFDGGTIELASRKLEVSASTIQISTNESSMSFGHTSDSPQGKIIIEGKGTPTFAMGPDADFISLATGSGIFMDGDGNFRFGDSDGGIIFENGNFAITGSDIDINVTDLNITATGFQLSSQEASMSLGTNRELLLKGGSANPYVSIGQSTDAYGETGVFLGYVSSVSRPRVSYVGSAGHFKFDSGVDIDTRTFELDANDGDLQISSTQKSMSLNDQTIVLDGTNAKITIGSGDGPVIIQGGASDNFMSMGNKTSFTHYDKSTTGIIIGMDNEIPKIEMAKSGDDYLRWDSTDGLDLRTTKMEVSASNIQISSTQASMSIGDPTSTGGAIVLQTQGTDKMLKFGNKTTFDQTTTEGLIMGINGDTSNDPEFDYTVGTGNSQYIRMLTSGIDIKVPSFKLDTDRLDIDSANSRIDIYDASGGDDGSDLRVRIGEVDPTTANHYGMVIYDGTGSGSADELVHFSDAKNQIASWSLSNTQISSQNLILDSAGIIQTSDFASGVQGWRITSANNGEAEFEKVTVRGTLATTVFEKESVNAVGGQLYIANSTIYTGSAQLASTNATMSVANVNGFAAGEILSAKKISATGFATEYMYVESASRDNPSSEKDLSGNLYLVRGYGLGITGESGSLGGTPGVSQSYESGQVIVSTGKVGTGFIRLNANPNDTTTPYMDVVERTGSGVYDVELKARLGDLSGLSSGLLYGNSNPGFGLFTENVFLQGGITAVTGSITGKLHVRTDALNQLIMGTDVDSHDGGTNDGIYLNENNYWFTNDKFRIGDTNYYLKWDSSNITIVPQTFELNAGSGDIQISSTQKSMSLGNGDIHFASPNSTTSFGRIGSVTTKAIYITGSATQGVIRSGKTSVSDTTEGFWLANNDSDAEFVVGDGTDYVKFDDNALTVKTRAVEINANSGDLQISSTQTSMSFANGAIELAHSGSNQAYMKLGSTGGQGIEMTGSNYGGTIRSGKTNLHDTDSGFWIHNKAGTSEFHLGDATDALKFNGSKFEITSSHMDVSGEDVSFNVNNFELSATDLQLSSTNKSASFGYNSSLAGGITLVGGSTSTIGFGTRGNYPMQLSSDGTDDYLRIGSQTFGGTQGGVILGSDNDVYKIELYKNESTYLKFSTDDSGLDVRANKIRLATPGMLLVGSEGSGGSNKLTLGGSSGSMSTTAGEGVYMDGSGNFRVGTATTVTSPSYMSFGSSALTVRTQDLVIDTSKIDITTEHGGMIALGASSASLSDLSGTGIFLSGSGEFNLEYDSSNYIRLDGSSFDIRSENFDLLTSTQHISSSNGGVIAMGSTIPKELDDDGIMLSGSGEFNFQENASNYIRYTAGGGLHIASDNIDISGGDSSIDVENFELDANNLEISSTQASMSLGEGKIKMVGASTSYITVGTAAAITLKDDGTDRYLVVGDKTSFTHFDKSTDGIILGTDDGTAKFEIAADTDNYLSFDGSGLDIKSETFGLRTSTMIISSSLSSGTIALGASPNSSVAGTNAGVYMDGTGDFLIFGDTDNYFRFDVSDKLDIKAETFGLRTSNLIISSSQNSGMISLGSTPNTSIAGTGKGVYMDGTGDFLLYGSATNLFSFDAAAASITMKSDTFSLTGTNLELSNTKFKLGTVASATDPDTTNSGFYVDSSGNFLVKGNTSGNDYFKVTAGGSIDIAAQNFNLNTSTIVMRSEGTGSISLGATPPTSPTSGTGAFINGSGDVLFGNSTGNRIQYVGGAAIVQSNTFTLNATTIIIDSATNDGKIALGATPPTSVAYTSNAGIYMDGTGDFLVRGDANNFLKFDVGGSPVLEIKAEDIDLQGSNFKLEADASSGTFHLGTITSDSDTSGAGVFMDSGGHFRVIGDANNQLIVDGGSMTLKSDTFSLDATSIYMDSAAVGGAGMIGLGTDGSAMSLTTGTGFYADGGGDFRVGKEKGVGISFDESAGQLIMSSSAFLLGTSGSAPYTGAYISGSNGNIQISSSNFHVKSDGDVIASAVLLDSVALADYFTFRTIIVNATTYANYVTSYSESSKTWWELVLDSSLGGDAGHMARIDNLDSLGSGNYFPFATFRPPSQNNYRGHYGDTTFTAQPPPIGKGSGHVIYTEAANYTAAFGWDNSNFISSGGGSDTDRYGIRSDSDDIHHYMFKENITYSGVDYATEKLMKCESGGRIQWVKSYGYDFRPCGFSSYAGCGQPLFDEGLIVKNSGDIGSVTSPDAMSIASNGVISGDFNDTSDIALKHNIRGFDNGMDLIRALNPVLFDWKKDGKGSARGFIAQEVEKILPEVVRGEEGKKSISMMGVVSSLTRAVQELIEENKTMKSAMNDLLSRDNPSSPAHGGLQDRDKLGKRLDGKTLDDYWKDKLK